MAVLISNVPVLASDAPDFEVLRESDDWMVVAKPAPLLIHPSSGSDEVTLVELLREHLGGAKVFLVNRLDRETSGCVLVARSRRVACQFGKIIARRGATKHYLAIVHGWPNWDQRRVETGLRRKGEFTESAIWVRQTVHPDGKESVTSFSVERRWENGLGRFAMIRCEPETGRTHQIRVHLEWVGHGIVGDKIYGRGDSAYLRFLEDGWAEDLANELLLPRQALHAAALGFPWEDGEILVECELTDDLKAFGVA